MNETLAPGTIIIFGTENDDNVQRLMSTLNLSVPSARLLRSYSMGEVESMIGCFDKGNTVLILIIHPGNIGDPFMMMKQKGALNGVRIILILPEIDDYFMRDYLNLAPSYITHLESDFKDVVSVITKMGTHLAN